jgi:chemotaxis protein MotB
MMKRERRMFRRTPEEEGSNFWISYADLMAGRLFVFILLIGAIVSKSIILKSDLHEKEARLEQISINLVDKKAQLDALNRALNRNREIVAEKDKSIAMHRQRMEVQLQRLKQKEEEIERLRQSLEGAGREERKLRHQLLSMQNLLQENNATLHKTKTSLEARSRMLATYRGEVAHLSERLRDANRTLQAREQNVLKLRNALDERTSKYDALIADMQRQKVKIKALTGIRIQVVAALKKALGDKIAIDKKSGSLRLSSNILFDKGSAVLKEEAKRELKQAFEEYIGTLVTDPAIKPYLDKIIIEGHTDSDGGYLYNLELSQRRAFAVMHYLLTLDFSKTYNIRPLMIASGRAYLDAVKVNGIEDKNASRRIEIKFRLKNEDAMHEIEKVLDAK